MTPYVTQYQSANLSNEQSIENFVVRTKEFERVMADIRTTDKDSSFQHYVFVGRRGSGKSTLLRRIQAEVCTDSELKEKFIVTNLSEEQAGIYKLYDLWDYVIRDLQAKNLSLPEINWQEYQDDLKEYTKVLYDTIHELLHKEDKRLILLVDNIDRIFKNIGKDANLLREQLMNFNDVRIIGGSTIMAENFWRYDMPFYQFFSVKRLEPLSMEEIKMLLEHWAEAKEKPEIANFVEKHPGKIQAVRMLTDGTPRTMLLFIDMLIDREDQQGFDYLRRIIDNATPIYQERLGQLSHQQQKIVTELSFFWEAASVEQLVPVCKMTGKNISAQMAQLVKARIVEKVTGDKKNMYYRLEERFFNLWLLMTQGGPKQKREAKYLTVFLEAWYEPDEIQEIYDKLLDQLEANESKEDHLVNMVKALAHSNHITWIQRDLILAMATKNYHSEVVRQGQLPEKALEILDYAIAELLKGKQEEAFRLVDDIEQLDSGLAYALTKAFHSSLEPNTIEELVSEKKMKNGKWRSALLAAVITYLSNNQKSKEEYIPLVKEFASDKSITDIFPTLICPILLWSGQLEKFEGIWEKAKAQLPGLGINTVSHFLTLILVHKQYNLLLDVFKDGIYAEELRLKANSHYYATRSLMNSDDPELQRMPPELQQNVSDIVTKVKERQEFFYGKPS